MATPCDASKLRVVKTGNETMKPNTRQEVFLMELNIVRVAVQKEHLMAFRKYMAVFPEINLGGQMKFS